MGDHRTPDMALLPGERAMAEAEWAEYGGLSPTLKAYCHRLLREEAEARRLQRLDALEVVEWRHRAMRVMDRLGAAEKRAEALEREVERLRGLLSAERDGYAAGVADGRKAGAGEERDLIVACLRDFERNGPPGLLSGAAQHIEAGCHWPQPLGSIW